VPLGDIWGYFCKGPNEAGVFAPKWAYRFRGQRETHVIRLVPSDRLGTIT